MDFDIPTDLITKVQIGFRESAGLSSFSPTDTTLPSISSVEASVSSLDPSPPYLRCKFCQGKLLRGLQSLLCIYCGEYQTKDLHPEPISFNSTHGYSWLLQSLNFNGSERIGSLAEASGINGGQSPAEDELTLSELLDLKISWQGEPGNLNTKASELNSSLNLGTTDFDHFFTKSISRSAIMSDAPEEQSVASKADQNKIVESEENFPSDWNAEFQSADTKMENEKPESVDPFKDVKADLTAHIDSVFGKTESFDFNRMNDDSDPFQNDLFATFQQNEQLDSVVQAKDGLPSDLNELSSKSVDGDWFSDSDWQKRSVKSTLKDESLQDNPNYASTDWFEDTTWQKNSVNNKATVKDDNLFDFEPHVNDVIQPEKPGLDNSDITDWFQDSQWAVGGSSSTANIVVNKDDDDHNVDDDDDDGFGEWNDFTTSTVNQDSWKESGNKEMPEIDLFQSTNDEHEVDFGNFLQHDILSVDKIPTDTVANRNANAEARNGEITPDATASLKTDVQMLISQMHNLSFMLKDELSIPSKAGDNDTSNS